MLHNSAADNCAGSPANSYLQAPFAASWGVQTNTLAQPSTPVITHAGTAGSATWTYTVVAAVGPTVTQPSATGSTATGNATLTTGNYNIVTWTTTPNADYYIVYRTVSGGTPATLGAIAKIPSGSTNADVSCSASTCVLNDKALTGDTTTAQAYNSTGQVYVGTGPGVGGGTGGGMFSLEGTVPSTLLSTAHGWYANSTNHCFDIVNGTTDEGCAAAAALATTFTATQTFPNVAFSGSAPAITTPGTTPYLNINTLMKDTQNTCTFALTTGTFTLALSPVSLCTWTLPNAAVTWYWTCTMGWSNVAGTTPTFAEGVKWAQAPSSAFQMANILTTNTGTSTQLTTATTTNANILATGTVTNSATLFQATMSGKFTSSATSGTFSPTVSLTGTSATGTAVGGCTIQ
jgi:hypothetical protein